eukprot:146538_1
MNRKVDDHFYKTPRYESENSQSKSQSEELLIELNTKRATSTKHQCITNEIHIFPYQTDSCNKWCSFCSENCRCCITCYSICDIIKNCALCSITFIGVLIALSIIVAVILAIIYGGYLVVLEGIQSQKYGNSFDIKGLCYVTSAKEEETQSESCSTDANGVESCTTSTDYTSYYDYYVSQYNNFTTFPCIYNEDKIYSHSESGHLKHYESDLVNCYTNDECDDVFMDTNNKHHATAIGIYIGAGLIFCVDLCCVVGCFIATFYGIMIWGSTCINCMFGNRFRVNCDVLWLCCECIGYCNELKLEKENFYRKQWNNIGCRKQCDYILGYWIRKPYMMHIENVLVDDVVEIIVNYYEDS